MVRVTESFTYWTTGGKISDLTKRHGINRKSESLLQAIENLIQESDLYNKIMKIC